jgi:N-alpha-acetyl-L-2,4-diaminobutyrate deacetylase
LTNPISAPVGFERDGLQQDNAQVFSQHNGLLEPCVKLVVPVQTGDLIARLYATERTGSAPVESPRNNFNP